MPAPTSQNRVEIKDISTESSPRIFRDDQMDPYHYSQKTHLSSGFRPLHLLGSAHEIVSITAPKKTDGVLGN